MNRTSKSKLVFSGVVLITLLTSTEGQGAMSRGHDRRSYRYLHEELETRCLLGSALPVASVFPPVGPESSPSLNRLESQDDSRGTPSSSNATRRAVRNSLSAAILLASQSNTSGRAITALAATAAGQQSPVTAVGQALATPPREAPFAPFVETIARSVNAAGSSSPGAQAPPANTYSVASATAATTAAVAIATPTLAESPQAADSRENLVASVGTTNGPRDNAGVFSKEQQTPSRVDLGFGGDLQVPSGLESGESFLVRRTYNVGQSDANTDFSISYVASTDQVLGNADDVVLGTERVTTAQAKAVGVHAGNGPRLEINQAGDYTLFARIDPDNRVGESNESNNVASTSRITIAPSNWYVPRRSADTRVIYVSSSTGDDRNSGLTPDAAKKSIAAGKSLLRDGSPDWLLLKKGDVWNEAVGQIRVSGRAQDEPIVISSYGESADRPLLRTGAADGISTSGANRSPLSINNVVVTGIHFYANTRDPDSADFRGPDGGNGVNWLRGTTGVLVEDCMFDSFKTGMVFQDFDKQGQSNVQLRRNIIVDSYNTVGHSQGIFTDGVDGLLMEENFFDHNGWNDRVAGGEATIFNHNIYIQYTNRNVVLRNNIIARGSSHGAQLRPGGVAEGNLFVANSINLMFWNNSTGVIRDNVILNAKDITKDLPRGWGIDLTNVTSVDLTNNIVANINTNSPNRFAIRSSPNARYVGNIVYNWGNDPMTTRDALADPSRSIERYYESVGGVASLDNYLNDLRNQSKDDFRSEMSAQSANTYIRQGFSTVQGR